MKNADISILNRIQLNAEDAVSTIDVLREKVYEEGLERLMVKKMVAYSGMKNKAVSRLIESKATVRNPNAVEELMSKGSFFMDTVFDISTSHIANLMIRKQSARNTKLWHDMNIYQDFSVETAELARELTELENITMEELRRFL